MLDSSPWSLIAFVDGYLPRTIFILYVLIAALALQVVYYRYLHPLATIPGPFIASISGLYLSSHSLAFQQCKTLHSLIQKYGPVVRIAPNIVVFNTVDAAREIYRDRKLDKGPKYLSVRVNGDGDHAMTTLDVAEHARTRNSYAAHYSPGNLVKSTRKMHGTVEKALKALERRKDEQDALVLFRHVMVDVVCDTLFGYQYGAVEKWDEGIVDELADAVADWPKRGIVVSILPSDMFNVEALITTMIEGCTAELDVEVSWLHPS